MAGFMYLLSALCLISVISGAVVPSHEWQGRIIGGNPVEPGEYPHVAQIRSNINEFLCSAVIVNTRWVLTHAECVDGRSLISTRIVVGELTRTDGTLLFVSIITTHPDYVPGEINNDLAVVATFEPLVFSDSVQSYFLGNTFVGGGVSVAIVGWGETIFPDGDISESLKENTAITMTNANCQSLYAENEDVVITDNNLCTHSSSTVGTCVGDSGGPVTMGTTVIGLISHDRYQCGVGDPDIHLRISGFRAWIVENTVIQ